MNTERIKRTMKNVERSFIKHSPSLLTGLGIAGMISSTIMAVKSTPKALYLIEQKKEEKGVDNLPTSEVIKICWRGYMPTAVMTTLSVGCLICANTVSTRRTAALATAYTISEAALKEYQDKVVEVIGEKKEQSIRDAVAKDQINNHPVSSSEVIITSRGNTLCFDPLSSRYFYSDIEKLRKTENSLNRQMMQEMCISLNEFYYELGLDGTQIGDSLGWNIDRGFIDLYFSSQLSDDDRPCIVVNHRVAPEYGYNHC